MIRFGVIGFGVLFILAALIFKFGNLPNPAPAPISVPLAPLKPVHNSPLDGSVRQVEGYLHNYLKDPKSFEAIEWGKVVERTDSAGGGFVVRLKYRAKNSFGGYNIEEQLFYLDQVGTVILVSDYKGSN